VKEVKYKVLFIISFFLIAVIALYIDYINVKIIN